MPCMFGSIFGLSLASGIKDMLFSNGFTSVEHLLKMPPAELAVLLGIDLYVARIIYLTAKAHMQTHNLQEEINQDERIYAAKKGRI